MYQRIKDFKYMRSSADRILGRADIQIYWLDTVARNEASAIIKEHGPTQKLDIVLENCEMRKWDTLYVAELSRLGNDWDDLCRHLTMIKNKGIRLVPIRHSTEARYFNRDFMRSSGYEQQELLKEAKEVYRRESRLPNYLADKSTIRLDYPEEESLLLAVLKKQVTREEAMIYMDVGQVLLVRELYRKEDDLCAREDLVKPFTNEVLEEVKKRAMERRAIPTQRRFRGNEIMETTEPK